MIATLSRTYAQAVAGRTVSMAFSTTTKQFDLKYVANAGATAPTEIYLNEAVHYPNGFTCTAVHATCSHVGKNRVLVDNDVGATVVTVSIVQQ